MNLRPGSGNGNSKIKRRGSRTCFRAGAVFVLGDRGEIVGTVFNAYDSPYEVKIT
jgi:hypothetical protein